MRRQRVAIRYARTTMRMPFVMTVVVACACGTPPATTVRSQPVAPRSPSAGNGSNDEPAAAAGPLLQPPSGTLHYWPKPIPLEVWPATWLGLAPGERVDLFGIECLHDATGKKPKTTCTASLVSPTLTWFRDRLGRCFAVTPRVPSKDMLDRMAAAWGRSPKGPRPAVDGMRAPGAFIAVKLTHTMLSPERTNMCEHAEQRPDQPICTPGPGTPTGRNVRSEGAYEMVLAPAGVAAPDALLLSPFDANRLLNVAWIFIGTWTDKFVANAALETMVGNENGGGGVSDPGRALAALEKHALVGTPELRAAMLVDRAIAAIRIANLAKARAATQQLTQLLAAEPVDRKTLLLDTTMPSLAEATSGRWLLSDPCGAAVP
jgi:hypothetical protein